MEFPWDCKVFLCAFVLWKAVARNIIDTYKIKQLWSDSYTLWNRAFGRTVGQLIKTMENNAVLEHDLAENACCGSYCNASN